MEVQGLPCAQVGPSERGLEHPGAAGLLHHSVVYRDGGAVLVYPRYEILLFRGVVVGVSVLEQGVHFGKPFLQSRADGRYVPDEYAGVPEKLSALDEDLCQIFVGLLGESLYLVCYVAVNGLGLLHVALDVSVAGLGTGRVDPQGKEFVLAGGIFHGRRDGVNEKRVIGYEMIRGSHDHRGIRVLVTYLRGRIGYARGSVAPVGLRQDVLGRKVGQMLLYQVGVGG